MEELKNKNSTENTAYLLSAFINGQHVTHVLYYLQSHLLSLSD